MFLHHIHQHKFVYAYLALFAIIVSWLSVSQEPSPNYEPVSVSAFFPIQPHPHSAKVTTSPKLTPATRSSPRRYVWQNVTPKPVAKKIVLPVAAPGSVRAKVLATWPGDDRWVDRTVSCESGYNPRSIGGGGNHYHGLFQFGPWARRHYGEPLNMTVEQQTLAAWRLILASGSGQWSCSPYSYHPKEKK